MKLAANRAMTQEFKSLNQVIKFTKEQANKLPELKDFLKASKFDVKNLTVDFITSNWTTKVENRCAYTYTRNGIKTTCIKTRWSCWDILTVIAKVSKESK